MADLSMLKNPLVIGGLVGAAVTFLAYLDKKYNETQYTTGMFLKMFIFVTLIVAGMLYMMSNTIQLGGGGGNIKKVSLGGGSKSYDVYANVPDF